MYHVKKRENKREKRKLRVRRKIYGTEARPRLSVFRSNKYVYGQLINDETGTTLASISATDIRKAHEKGTRVDAAFELGKEIAKKAKEAKITKVVFDRKGYKYHGRVKNFADGAREGGLEF